MNRTTRHLVTVDSEIATEPELAEAMPLMQRAGFVQAKQEDYLKKVVPEESNRECLCDKLVSTQLKRKDSVMNNSFQKVMDRVNKILKVPDPPVPPPADLPLERMLRRISAERAWRHRLRKKPRRP